MSGIIKMVVVLSAICGIAGFSLSYLRATMTPLIEVQVLTYVQAPAIQAVFGEVDNDPVADRKKFSLPDGREVTVFPAKRGGKLYGVALEEFSPGYGGQVGVMVGIDPENSKLLGIGVTTMSETPGLGTLIAAPKFSGQFKGAPFEVALLSKGGTIDAVAGATISSTAAVESVLKAVATYDSLKGELATAWQ